MTSRDVSAQAMAAAIERLPAAWFKPRPFVYWWDMLASAAIGWIAFAGAVGTDGLERAVSLTIAAVALYRAALFIHEVAHLAPGDVPGFTWTWNVLVGVPVLLPSFLYDGVHLDHHRPQHYGSIRDPEYVPFARQSLLAIATFAAGAALLPLILVLRFGIVAPASWIAPPLRRTVLARGSSLVINPGYIRRTGLTTAGFAQEIACTAMIWTAVTLCAAGIAPVALFVCWLIVVGSGSTVNALRTLAAHRYAYQESESVPTPLEQLLDTCTLTGQHPLQMLGAPLGLRYHALHHWIPSLPYHNLGRAHRRLASSLPADVPYHDTTVRSISGAVVDLLTSHLRM